jgi:5-methylcytosine-specific restriction protein A
MARTGFHRTDGLSAAARGYNGEWRRLRLQVLAAEPLCRKCASQGRVTAATQVHHVKAFQGIDDPLRLDPSNCEPICEPCHLGESARQASGTTLVAVGVDGWPVS